MYIILFHNHHHPYLSYDRSTASSKASSPRSASQCFLFQLPVISLFLKVIQQLLTSSSSSFHHLYTTLYLFFDNVFLMAVPTQDVANPVGLPPFYCMQDIPLSLTLCNISPFVTRSFYINNRPKRCNTKQSIYYSASSLYMFRVSTTPINRNTQNCNYSLRYCAKKK